LLRLYAATQSVAPQRILTYEKALTWLLGLMGTRVEVTIVSEEPRGLLATLRGELAAGGEIEQSYPSSNEGFVFRIGGADASGFVLESRMLRRAVLLESPDDQPAALRFYLGITTVLQVNALENPRADEN
jgi:hypothetical protein